MGFGAGELAGVRADLDLIAEVERDFPAAWGVAKQGDLSTVPRFRASAASPVIQQAGSETRAD